MIRAEVSTFCTLLPQAIDKFAAFGEIVRNCSVFDDIPDRHAFLESVIRREKIQSTGIGHGVAIAHGKVPHLEKTHIALGLSEDGICFDDTFSEPVRLVFLIASSPTRQSEYVKALGSLLSWVHDDSLRSALRSQDFANASVKAFFNMMESQDFSPPEER